MKLIVVFGGIVGVIYLLLLIPSREVSLDASYDHFSAHEGAICREAEADLWVDFIIVTLSSNPTTGFEWQLTEVTNQVLLDLMNKEYIPPDANELEGAAGKEVWTFGVHRQGNVTFSMEYSQPWEGGTKAAWTFDLALDVR